MSRHNLNHSLTRYVCIAIFSMLVACSPANREDDSDSTSRADPASKALSEQARFFSPPKLEILSLKEAPTSQNTNHLIWGAIGISNDDTLYMGLSPSVQNPNSATFLSTKVGNNTQLLSIEGVNDTMSQFKREGLSETFAISDRIQGPLSFASDKYIYFVSHDNQSKTKDQNPLNGGHLWQLSEKTNDWRHVLSTEQALIATATHGRFVYALGYWHHILYQYDTITQRSTNIPIGSVRGHYSRQFILKGNGNVFVPRIETLTNGKRKAVLVELSPDLSIADLHPMEDYWNMNGYGNHGIVASTTMDNSDVYFTVASGGLYRLHETISGRSALDYLGKFDKQSANIYISSLFSPDKENILVALGRSRESDTYMWFIKELGSGASATYPIVDMPKDALLLYGSEVKDSHGNYYIAGGDKRNAEHFSPILLRASYKD